MQVFLVLGYGVPQDIFEDENYKKYLSLVFEGVKKRVAGTTTVVFCGGPTDMFPPLERTEAAEMKRYFSSLMTDEDWKLLEEDQSLSTLENLINAKALLDDEVKQVIIFGEFVRQERIHVFAKEVFKDIEHEVVPVDFDQSARRHQPKEEVEEQEQVAIKFGLWALKSEENLQRYKQVFQDKITTLRNASPEQRGEVHRAFWKKTIEELKSSPDFPDIS